MSLSIISIYQFTKLHNLCNSCHIICYRHEAAITPIQNVYIKKICRNKLHLILQHWKKSKKKCYIHIMINSPERNITGSDTKFTIISTITKSHLVHTIRYCGGNLCGLQGVCSINKLQGVMRKVCSLVCAWLDIFVFFTT